MNLLQAQLPDYVYYNFAQNGAQIPDVVNQYNTEVAPSFNGSRSQNILFIFMGTNDIRGQLASVLYPQYVSLSSTAQSAGFLPIIVPVPPSTTFNASDEIQRGLLNGMLQSGWPGFAEAYANILSVPETNDPSNPVYYPDGTHPSNALYALWEPVMQGAVQSLPVAA